MHRRLIAFALPLALAALAAPAANAAPAAGDLYVATTNAGTVKPLGHGNYRLTLAKPATTVTAFTDRPERSSSTQTLKSFVSDWASNGFSADHPNAALVVDGNQDTATYELSRPRLNKSGKLTLHAKRLSGHAPKHFGHASVFIDASGTQTPLQITVNGLPNNQAALFSFNDGVDLTPTPYFGPEVVTDNGGFVKATPTGLVIANSKPGDGTASDFTADIGIIHGNGPITGTLSVGAGATVSISVNGGAPVAIGNGPFSIPVS